VCAGYVYVIRQCEMSTRVSLSELLDAFEWVSTAGPFENVAYVSRESGKIWLVSDFDDTGDEPPEDADDDSLYLTVPRKAELDLGRSLAIEFTEQELADCSKEVRGFFAKAGAYAKFKDLLAERGALEAWYAYEASGVQKALRAWAAENDIELIE
jgi:hypothetical protein